MKAVRRALLAVSGTAVIALLVRLRGRGGVPPQRGGWQEIPFDRTA